jgi:ech hydrogenase subunit C
MRGLTQSPWILHYDASSCNGCDIETLACLTPLYDVERLGVVNTGNPKHADIFLVTGAVNEQSKTVIENLYRQLPEPKVVVAVGACASTGGIFRDCYNISGGADVLIPVDVYVPGCPARPEAIIDGVVQALSVMKEKHALLAASKGSLDQVLYTPAERADAAYILALRQAAARADAILQGDDSFPDLQQTPEDLVAKFDHEFFFKAVVNGQIVGAVSGTMSGGAVSVSVPTVHPYFQNHSVGAHLLEKVEEAFHDVKRFEARVGDKCEGPLRELTGAGYRQIRTEAFTPKITWLCLQKDRP